MTKRYTVIARYICVDLFQWRREFVIEAPNFSKAYEAAMLKCTTDDLAHDFNDILSIAIVHE